MYQAELKKMEVELNDLIFWCDRDLVSLGDVLQLENANSLKKKTKPVDIVALEAERRRNIAEEYNKRQKALNEEIRRRKSVFHPEHLKKLEELKHQK